MFSYITDLIYTNIINNLVVFTTIVNFVTLSQSKGLKLKVMRIIIKADEKRKQQLIYLCNGTKSIEVQGEYYKGCQLIKHVNKNKTVLEIK